MTVSDLDRYLGLIGRDTPLRCDGGIVEDGYSVEAGCGGEVIRVLQSGAGWVEASARGYSDRVSMLWSP